jgi:hypothetical protein
MSKINTQRMSSPIRGQDGKKRGNLVIETTPENDRGRLKIDTTTYELNGNKKCISNGYSQYVQINGTKNLFTHTPASRIYTDAENPKVVDKTLCE